MLCFQIYISHVVFKRKCDVTSVNEYVWSGIGYVPVIVAVIVAAAIGKVGIVVSCGSRGGMRFDGKLRRSG